MATRTTRKAPASSHKKGGATKWSGDVTAHSNALDLEKDIFKQKDPKKIAASVKQSAEQSTRKKAGPFRSAMSMITFYENRAGTNLTAAQKKVLDRSKEELRKLYGKA